MKKRKWGKGKKGKGKGGGRCAPAATATAVGHAWRRHASAGHGGWARGQEGREEKGERGKEGAGFAAAGRDASRWMGKMGRELNSGVGLVRKNSWNRVQGLRGVELNEKQL